ncbi:MULTISPECIES: D-cysteine desulfhydrase family protein [Streptomyces]|uniref:D-cysteine desulfhydrase family protein n=1 Tax=unclassified Streptomyces TaxID=2593676 RepID=UPI0008904C77|nr:MULTISPECIES: D-cysteine desulfhydrase family protein [unclassified Streptomyces]MDX2733237.1 D-cysteine desulfhydrase family protein [Streptomyces sp. PA03-2a]SCX94965.1 D-cysteine desulfhydrase [Streptomyces sp. 136MFCol5.1]SFS41847.1 D-cysteine desulfhydrase [Streptomyces sp. ok210]
MTSDSPTSQRAVFGTWPTPLEPMPRLARAIGLGAGDLWVKRDDLTGLGGGGNKVRKLEWTCGAALADGATALVTTGAPQSNHARLTAAAGARLGLDVVLVLAGAPGSSASGNLALDGLFGATVVWAGDVDDKALDSAAEQVAEELRGRGAVPALIPFGGSSVLGARGYAECGRELLVQAPDLATVVVAVGSGGTMAGLLDPLGSARVLGVHCGAVADPARTVSELATGLSGTHCAPEMLRLRLDQVGDGYATLTEAAMAALTLTARTEGIVLDPIYTGRAMAGLIAAIEEGDVVPGQRTIFLHSGGMPGLFGHAATLAALEEALKPSNP